MYLPHHVAKCIEALEQASFPTYAVGGCVRDSLLELTPQDYDLCTAASPEALQQVFSQYPLVLAGLKHGTVGVIFPEGVVEITTFRTEGDYSDGRHPGWVRFVPTLEEDLARRDFTINAMAWSPKRGLSDPFGGERDLKYGILRAVGNPFKRFQEDALRILRGARFAVKYQLRPHPDTLAAMESQAPLMDALARERVYDELCKLICLAKSEDFLRYSPIITQVIPELAPAVGFDQHSPHHAYPLYEHIAHVTESVPPQLPLRWAALLHDVGKPKTFTLDEKGIGHFYGHAKESADMAEHILRRLKAPTALREQAVTLISQHMTRLEPDRKLLRRRLSRLGKDTVEQLLLLQQADMGSKGSEKNTDTEYQQIRKLLDELYAEDACFSLKDLAVTGSDLIELGFTPGRELGECLNWLLEQVVDEALPNHRPTLLTAANQKR